jgi:uncharacterized protein DUF3592
VNPQLWIVPALGAVLLVVGLVMFVQTRRFLATAATTQGTVVGYQQRRSSKGRVAYKPIVRFTTATGSVEEFTDSVSSSPPGYEEGAAVLVLYDAKNPGKARLDSGFRLWLLPALLSGIGLAFLVVGVVLVVTQ